MRFTLALLLAAAGLLAPPACLAQASAGGDLVIASAGDRDTVVVVSPTAGPWEKRGAADLVKYIGQMTGAAPTLADTAAAAATALQGRQPTLLVGEAALQAEPRLRARLTGLTKKDPVVRSDAVVVQRAGSRIYLAGSNDESDYYAVSYLLQQWGCRWYMPTEFGECVPSRPTLTVGQLNYAYAPPFEIRNYWLSWNGSAAGEEEFQRRNYMSSATVAGAGEELGKYTKDLVPPGKTPFDISFADEATAAHVAEKIAPEYAKGTGSISLAIEDGSYTNNSPADQELRAGLFDKYMQRDAMTDPMMVFYNRVARILRERYPDSKTRIGGMAYANVTLPPQRPFKPEKSLVMWLAPIDIDPNHAIDDPRSPSTHEYGAMMDRWASLMEGRLAIYDYDQGMLVWRDLPDPSQFVFQTDAKRYRAAGILGIGTESRGATATTFLNLFFRGQLMWNPDADVQVLLTEFYQNFYGPAAAPMSRYWNTIFQAWEDTLTTEHEVFAAPAIYTPGLVAALRPQLEAAEALVRPLQARQDLNRTEKLYLERMTFTRLGFEVLSNYVAMVQAAAVDVDYKAAAAAGDRALAAREALTRLNDTFTTYKVIGENGTAWWPGEVKQYRDLLQYTDGTKGRLLVKTPLEWAFRRDPHDTGLASGWAYQPADLSYWNQHNREYTLATLKDYPDQWEMLRTDLYMQAQGVRFPDQQSFTGYAWYRTNVDLPAAAAAQPVHVRFPGLFNECWLYVNGGLVAHRTQNPVWWYNDYGFEWDVDLAGKLAPGANTITVRLYDPHHFGGMFRRPFLYRPVP